MNERLRLRGHWTLAGRAAILLVMAGLAAWPGCGAEGPSDFPAGLSADSADTRDSSANSTAIGLNSDYFVAIELCSALSAAGAEVIGPARDLQTGLAALRNQRIDCGVLDLNLRGQMAFPIATELRARGIPAIFATGYDVSMIPAELVDTVRLEKPVDLDALCRAVESACL